MSSVRPRVPHDLPACVRSLREVHTGDGYPSWWPSDPAAWLSPPGWTAAWVAEAGGTVAGHVCVVAGVADPVVTAITGIPAEGLLSLSRLFVVGSARGQGLGEQLLAAAAAHAEQQPGRQLMLDVMEDGGPAVAFYERLGWRLADRRISDWATPQGVRLPMRVYLAPAVDPLSR